MRVFYRGSHVGEMPVTVCPAGHLDHAGLPAHWLDKGKPISFTVTFRGGEARVPDDLGRYLIAQKIASPIILPRV